MVITIIVIGLIIVTKAIIGERTVKGKIMGVGTMEAGEVEVAGMIILEFINLKTKWYSMVNVCVSLFKEELLSM